MLGKYLHSASPKLDLAHGGQSGLQVVSRKAGPVSELLALSWVVRRLVPSLVRPIVPFAVLAGATTGSRPLWGVASEVHNRIVDASGIGHLLRGSRFGRAVAMQLFAQTAGVGGVLKATGAAMASRSRSATISVDRLAALAAGDADAAVSALVRAKRLLPEDCYAEQLKYWLDDARAHAAETKWASRRKAITQGACQPAVEVRIHELLKWADGRQGRQLIDLANLRRGQFHKQQRWQFGFSQFGDNREDMFKSSLIFFLLVVWVILPVWAPVDAVWWASWCTLGISFLGVGGPIWCWGGGTSFGLSFFPSLFMAMIFSLYMFRAGGMVWWNHIFGGSRQWIELSAKLGSQLSDQADTAAGMAYLARNWAEMAHRSLAALDEELCGSWRTSLQELASKLHDMQQMTKHQVMPSTPPQFARRQIGDAPGVFSPSSRTEQQESEANLWSKVDAAIQRALAIETLRMRRALNMQDPRKLQEMVQWWVNDAAEEPRMDSRISAKTLDSFLDSDGPIHESLAHLFLHESLQKRYEYMPFSSGEDESRDGNGNAASPPEEVFHRLESQLRRNTVALQDLRNRMEPILQRRARFLTFAAFRSMMREWTQVWSKVRPRMKVQKYDKEAADGKEERMVLRYLTGFAGLAAAGAFYFLFIQVWLWALCCWAFSIANAIIVLNHDRLAMPYVHQRLQGKYDDLASKQDAIRSEIYNLEQLSQRQGVAYLKALVHRQSVNVLRNINYMVLCIKTELQQAVAKKMSKGERQQVLFGYLRLMNFLLPHDEHFVGWSQSQDALSADDCAPIAALLDAPMPEGQEALACPIRQEAAIAHERLLHSRLQESPTQRRLWLVFRLLHFSSAMPGVAQGQLQPLLEQTFKKVVVEGILPLPKSSGMLALGASQHLAGESDSTSKGSTATARSAESSGERRRSTRRRTEGVSAPTGGSGSRSQPLALAYTAYNGLSNPSRVSAMVGQVLANGMRPTTSY